MVLINARSLLSCHAEVCQLFHRAGTTLMGVAETWLDETVPDGEVCPAGVSIVRNDRNRRGGGVACCYLMQLSLSPDQMCVLGILKLCGLNYSLGVRGL